MSLGLRIGGEPRVVITGMGIVSPLGCSPEALWRALREGTCSIERQQVSSKLPFRFVSTVHRVGRDVKEFGPLPDSPRKLLRKALKLMNRETILGVVAGQQAVRESGLSGAGYSAERVGVSFGAGNVSIQPEDFLAGALNCRSEAGDFDPTQWGEAGLEQVDPLWILKCLPNAPACYLSMLNDFQGPNNTITEGPTAANTALSEAFVMVQEGIVDAMLAGAAGTLLEPVNVLHQLISDDISISETDQDPHTVCRPFDRNRTGSIPAEGAAVFVLERSDAATARNATIYGELIGTSATCAVGKEGTPQPSRALANALRLCLHEAELMPKQIGHVHAHAQSSQLDAAEAQALAEIFGEGANSPFVVALKSYIGNPGAAGGALELAASLLSLRSQLLFPILNYDFPDPECPVRAVRSADEYSGETVMNISLSSEGQASCVAVRAWNRAA